MIEQSTMGGANLLGASSRRPLGRRRRVLSALAAFLFALAGHGGPGQAWAAGDGAAASPPPPLETLDSEDPAAIVAATSGLVLVDLYAEW